MNNNFLLGLLYTNHIFIWRVLLTQEDYRIAGS